MNKRINVLSVQANSKETDRLQRVVARLVATSPAGVNLLLIGGFRYRLLDNSQRFSVAIEYHWGGELDAKQQELLALCRRVILGQVRRELGYEGSVSVRTGPDADSPNARFVDLRFWKGNIHIEIPLEVTQIVCLDPSIIRTAGGTVHPTPSDADLIESKVIAVLNRIFLQHRDLVDIFLLGQQNLRVSRSPGAHEKPCFWAQKRREWRISVWSLLSSTRRGCPCNPWSKAKNSSLPRLAARCDILSHIGRSGHAVEVCHFGPHIVPHSHLSLRRQTAPGFAPPGSSRSWRKWNSARRWSLRG